MAISRTLFIIITFASFSPVVATPRVVATVAGGGFPHGTKEKECIGDGSESRDGKTHNARFHYPWGIAYDPFRNVLYVGDCGCRHSKNPYDTIRKLDIKTGHVTTLAGGPQGYQDGVGEKALFYHPAGMSLHRNSRTLFVCDSGNNRIRSMDVETGEVTTFVGNGHEEHVDGKGTNAAFSNPQAVAVDHIHKDRFFVADTDNHAIREVSLPDGEVTTVAGGSKGFKNGKGRAATFYHPAGVTIDPDGFRLFVADHYNHVLRLIDLTDHSVTTFVGSGQPGFVDGIGTHALFNYPEGMAYDTEYKVLYVVEFDNNCIRAVNEEGKVKLFVGGHEGLSDGVGDEAQFFHPTGMTYDEANKIIYITDQYNHRVRSISAIGSKIAPPGTITVEKVISSFKEGHAGTAFLSLTFILFFALLFTVICRRRGRRYLSKV